MRIFSKSGTVNPWKRGAMYGILALAACGGLLAFLHGNLGDQHAIYFERCMFLSRTGNSCIGREYPGGRMSYRYLASRSAIEYFDVDAPTPRTYVNCAFVDAENWTCEGVNEDAATLRWPVRMQRGAIVFAYADPLFQKFGNLQTSEWHWRWLKLNAMFGN
jgi:hypothetical protein